MTKFADVLHTRAITMTMHSLLWQSTCEMQSVPTTYLLTIFAVLAILLEPNNDIFNKDV